MRLTLAFVAHEARTQARSLRFRVMAALYGAAGSVPAVVCFVQRKEIGALYGGATYLAETVGFLPLLTAVLAAVLSLDGVTREQSEGAWSTVSLTEIPSAGYLLRRWAALLAVLLPLTAVPFAAVAGLSAAAGKPASPEALAGTWLTVAVPPAVAFSGLGLALGTIGGGPVNSFLLLGAVLGFLPSLLNQLLARFGLRLSGSSDWLSLEGLAWGMARLTSTFSEGRFLSFPEPVSEAGFAPGVTGEQLLTPTALALSWGAAALGMAALYLRRTRPDVRVWRIPPKHPLRTFLAALSRFRERAVPDPSPAPADLLCAGLGLLAAAGLFALVLGRADRYTALARERFWAEQGGGPAPTSPDVVPGRWRIEGRLGPGEEVDLRVTAELRNEGAEPQRHLAFELDPGLRIASAAAGEGKVALARSWDRLTVGLTPPIPPGGRRELSFHLTGRPGEVAFQTLGMPGYGFFESTSRHLHARFPHDLVDFAQSYEVPAISGLRVDLAAADLTPVLRYRSWAPTADHRVPEETFLPPADVELSLAADPRLFLAESCGSLFRSGRLEARCRQPVGGIAVAGGRYTLLAETGSGARVAVFPGHRQQGERHLGFLARSAEMVDQAWPGLGGLEGTVVFEWPDAEAHDLLAARIAWRRRYADPPPSVVVRGRLVFVREMELILDQPLSPEWLVAELVSVRLSRRRAFAPEDTVFFRELFQRLALRRLGIGPEKGAVIGPFGMDMASTLSVPPPDTRDHNYWYDRFPALVAALEIRTGEETLRRAIQDVLAQGGGHPVSRKDLFDLLKARSAAPVDRMIRDFFVDGSLPEPVLEEVEFHQAGGVWRATGRMKNQGYGEALCKVVLTTDLTPAEAVVSAGTGEAAAFTLESPYRPQAVVLDPDRQCHRVVPKAAPRDRVNFQGGAL